MAWMVYQYPKCSTCRKALKWLEDKGVRYDTRDIVAEPPDVETLRSLLSRSKYGVRKLFNTSGQSYRNGGFKDRLPGMTEEQALRALASDGKLIKRPLVDAGDVALIGFDAEEWAAALA